MPISPGSNFVDRHYVVLGQTLNKVAWLAWRSPLPAQASPTGALTLPLPPRRLNCGSRQQARLAAPEPVGVEYDLGRPKTNELIAHSPLVLTVPLHTSVRRIRHTSERQRCRFHRGQAIHRRRPGKPACINHAMLRHLHNLQGSRRSQPFSVELVQFRISREWSAERCRCMAGYRHSPTVVRMPNLAVATHHETLDSERLGTHRTVGVQAGGGNADLGAEAELATIGEARGGVDHHHR